MSKAPQQCFKRVSKASRTYFKGVRQTFPKRSTCCQTMLQTSEHIATLCIQKYFKCVCVQQFFKYVSKFARRISIVSRKCVCVCVCVSKCLNQFPKLQIFITNCLGTFSCLLAMSQVCFKCALDVFPNLHRKCVKNVPTAFQTCFQKCVETAQTHPSSGRTG